MIISPLLVLFDLDGTVVDPAGVITGGISAALSEHGLAVPAPAQLQRMVGPALVSGLREIASVPETLIAQVVHTYRAGYRSHGMAASSPYPGIAECLGSLAENGVVCVIATQKPQWLAEELLQIQGLRHFFRSVHGSPRDEQEAAALEGKTTIIAAALNAHEGTFAQAVMVGDRRHDVEGAARNGLECIGVDWGFAAAGELESAGARTVVSSVRELQEELHGRL